MALTLEHDWVWDCWLAPKPVDGLWHIFYLKAPKSLVDPDLRHVNATVGHATSTDLTNWTHLETALKPGPIGAWNDRAIWTGSVLNAPDGTWRLFFTGTNKTTEGGYVQRIGVATSADLMEWTQQDLVIEANAEFYERVDLTNVAESVAVNEWPEEAWRDPWVFFDERDSLWHMLITSRGKSGKTLNRGAVGHAVSFNLTDWDVRPPLTDQTPFGHLEVLEVLPTEVGHVVTFCAAARDVDPESGIAQRTGTWSAPADSPTGPFHFDRAELIGDGEVYAGRVVKDTDGVHKLLGFVINDPIGIQGFNGTISDPMPLRVTDRQTFQLA